MCTLDPLWRMLLDEPETDEEERRTKKRSGTAQRRRLPPLESPTVDRSSSYHTGTTTITVVPGYHYNNDDDSVLPYLRDSEAERKLQSHRGWNRGEEIAERKDDDGFTGEPIRRQRSMGSSQYYPTDDQTYLYDARDATTAHRSLNKKYHNPTGDDDNSSSSSGGGGSSSNGPVWDENSDSTLTASYPDDNNRKKKKSRNALRRGRRRQPRTPLMRQRSVSGNGGRGVWSENAVGTILRQPTRSMASDQFDPILDSTELLSSTSSSSSTPPVITEELGYHNWSLNNDVDIGSDYCSAIPSSSCLPNSNRGGKRPFSIRSFFGSPAVSTNTTDAETETRDSTNSRRSGFTILQRFPQTKN